MKYFSRIELDPRHTGAHDAVAQCLGGSAYDDHQFLWNFFPAPQGAPRDFLFRRFDPQAGRTQPLFYCVSARPAVAPHPAWQVSCREYAPQVRAGDRLRFDLRVNPTEARKRDGKSRRDDVVMHAKKRIAAEHGVTRWADVPETARRPLYELAYEAVSTWLGGAGGSGLAARYGFRVADELRVDGYRRHRFAHRGLKDIELSTVDLGGTLEVTSAEPFERALLEGVGHGKAFGCGLLLVQRA